MIRDMHCHFDDRLSSVYPEGDGRKRRHATIDDYEESWVREFEKIKADPSTERPLKLAKCAEVLMLFTHHLPQSARDAFQKLDTFKLPSMPVYDETYAKHEDKEVAATYSGSYTCQTGHNMTGGDMSDHVLPHWPKETHYHGVGHGSYPFWLGTAGSGGSPGNIEAWWSETQQSELFYHETCYMSDVGYYPPDSSGRGDVSTPCYNLMTGTLGEAKGYLYTATLDYCCISTGTPEDLSPSGSNFMDYMTLDKTVDITTDYYSGEGYHYIQRLGLAEAVTYFWYVTTPEGLPIQQGEGGLDASTPAGKGLFIYHDYNLTEWEENSNVAIDSSVFEVPDICKTTTTTCPMP